MKERYGSSPRITYISLITPVLERQMVASYYGSIRRDFLNILNPSVSIQ